MHFTTGELKLAIHILKKAEKAFKKSPRKDLNNCYGICYFLIKTDMMNGHDAKTILNIVPGIAMSLSNFYFADSRVQQVIPWWQWRIRRERYKWCGAAIKEFNKYL